MNGAAADYDLTVIIPTLNEERNIVNIIHDVNAVFKTNSISGQILVVDDNSTDGTVDGVIARDLPNVECLIRMSDPGLSASVVDGFNRAKSDIILVIDADFSHPPELIPAMYKAILDGNDIVIGSRYMVRGGIENWPLSRRAISCGATLLSRVLLPGITDPVSGFFAIRKSILDGAELKPKGYKILLEILCKTKWTRCTEIPYVFTNRKEGTSKLRTGTILEFMKQWCDCAITKWGG